MPSESDIDLLRPLTRLPAGEHPGCIWVDPIYRSRGYEEALPDVWVRAALVPLLLHAALEVSRNGLGLLVWDGWRPKSLQQALHREYRARIARTSGMTGDRLDQIVADFVTDPERNASPPAHTTGGAIDVTLCDLATGEPRDMGGDFDELTARTAPSYYDDASDPTDRIYASRRRLLNESMTEVGFVRLPTEWWHFEYGTELWANERAKEVLFDATAGPT